MRSSHWKLLTIIIKGTGILFAFSLVVMIAAISHAAENDREIGIDDVMPRQVLQLKGGGEFQLPSQDGLTVLLFWSTWSPRSEPALELWQKFSTTYQDKPLHIVSVNAEKVELSASDLSDIDEYLEKNSVSLPVHMDEGLELFNRYSVKAVPTAFFLDSEGKILYKFASFPTSAPMDLEEEVEVQLGIRKRQTDDEVASRGKLEYQPKNNALLHYNMGIQLYKKNYKDKALQRFVIALQKDPDYEDPLRTLEGIYFGDSKTPEAEDELKGLLTENGLESIIEKIGTGQAIVPEGKKKIDAMEKMRLLLEKGKEGAP